MDDAVGGLDIRGGDAGGSVEDGGFAVEGDGYEGFVGGGNGSCFQVCAEDAARDDVVEEDVGEGGLVLREEEVVYGFLAELGKGLVCGGEDGEGAFAGEGGGEVCRAYSSEKSGEDACFFCYFWDEARASGGEEDLVYDVDYAVAGADVCGNDLGVAVDEEACLGG